MSFLLCFLIIFPHYCSLVDFNNNGICPVALEKMLESHSDSFKHWNETKERPYWAMLYLMPTFHNPTGYCMPPGLCIIIIIVSNRRVC